MTTALGPVVGGFLIDSLGWRSAFWINLPLAVAVVLLARAHVPESRSPAAGPIDWLGRGAGGGGLRARHPRADRARRARGAAAGPRRR